MVESIPVGIAIFAGLLSFISPCVLPLVPAYISYLTARATRQASAELAAATLAAGKPGGVAASGGKNRLGVFLHGVAFVSGFTFVFVVFGLLIYAGVRQLSRSALDAERLISQGGGILVIFFGLYLLGAVAWLLRLPWNRLGSVGETIQHFFERIQGFLYGDTRHQINPRNPYGYLGSALMGVVFAAGWTPCIGPIYGGILTLIANSTSSADLTQAAGLLFAYSMGLAVPFLLAAVALDQMRGLMKRLQRRMRLIEAVSGVFLIIMGYLLFTGQLALISQTGTGIAQFSANLESCAVGVVQGQLPLGDLGQCLSIGHSDYDKLRAWPLSRIVERMVPKAWARFVALSAAQPAANQSGAVPQSTPVPVLVETMPATLVAARVATIAAQQIGLEVGQTAPGFTVKGLDGNSLSLEAMRGKVVMVNFWATWCAPCIAEMPYFQQLADRFGERHLQVFAVNFLEKQETVAQFVTDKKLRFAVGLDPKGEISRLYQVREYPVTVILDRSGVILARQAGPFNLERLEAALQKWIGVE